MKHSAAEIGKLYTLRSFLNEEEVNYPVDQRINIKAMYQLYESHRKCILFINDHHEVIHVAHL